MSLNSQNTPIPRPHRHRWGMWCYRHRLHGFWARASGSAIIRSSEVLGSHTSCLVSVGHLKRFFNKLIRNWYEHMGHRHPYLTLARHTIAHRTPLQPNHLSRQSRKGITSGWFPELVSSPSCSKSLVMSAVYNIRLTHNLNVSHLVLQLSLCNPLQPGV